MKNDRTVPAADSSGAIRRLEFDVDFPPGHVAVYLLEGDEPVLIDAGDPGVENERTLEESLDGMGYGVGDVEHVVCTHPHIDHVGLFPQLLEAGDPTVYAPATYRNSLRRSTEELKADLETTARRAGIPEASVERVVDRGTKRVEEIQSRLPESAVDVWMEGGATVDVGDWTFDPVYTPGHQRDHLCLQTDHDGETLLFSGDMAIEPFRSAAVHAFLESEQKEAIGDYYESLDRLEGLSVDRVFPGHGPVHESLDTAVETARGSLDALLERTEAAVRDSGTHAAHAAASRADDPSDGPWLPEAIGALAYLEREGRLDSYLKDGVRYYVPA